MISYNLAEELKNKGFKQPYFSDEVKDGIIIDVGWFHTQKPYLGGAYINKEYWKPTGAFGAEVWKSYFELVGKKIIYVPTLLELINACGKEFDKLVNYGQDLSKEERELANKIFDEDTEWAAYSYKHVTYGKTPTEAVVKLYIKLHNKLK